MTLTPCKHLDYDESKYGWCAEIKTIEALPGQTIRYWQRDPEMHKGLPLDCQFCGAGRGRIPSKFNCYQPGFMSCYEPEAEG